MKCALSGLPIQIRGNPQNLRSYLYPTDSIFQIIDSRLNGKPLVIGKKTTDNSILLSNCDYLSISGHPDIVNAQVETLKNSKGTVIMSAVFLKDDSFQSMFEKMLRGIYGFEMHITTWRSTLKLGQNKADAVRIAAADGAEEAGNAAIANAMRNLTP